MSPLLKVKVKPRSPQAEFKWENQGWVARVSSLPEGGKANRDLIRIIAEYFHVPQKHVRIKLGTRSSTKWIQVPDSLKENQMKGGSHGGSEQ